MTAGTKTKKRKRGDKEKRRHGVKATKVPGRISKSKIQQIKRKISRKFPEFRDVQPVISEKVIKPQSSLYKKLSLGVPKVARRIFRLKFTKKVKTVDQIEIERILMVSLSAQGKIIKITESR